MDYDAIQGGHQISILSVILLLAFITGFTSFGKGEGEGAAKSAKFGWDVRGIHSGKWTGDFRTFDMDNNVITRPEICSIQLTVDEEYRVSEIKWVDINTDAITSTIFWRYPSALEFKYEQRQTREGVWVPKLNCR